jgi:NAD(P)-dependent dehydrogenase (short-subunit alcohol dehydrogenase family)
VSVQIDLSGKRSLVTGAGAGIGAQIALWLARAGAAVAVNDVRSGHAESVVDAIRSEGGHAVPVVTDCRVDENIPAMVHTVVSDLGGLDIAVNNIGMTAGLPQGTVDEIPAASWRGIVDQNLVLTALCGQAEAKAMAAQGSGGVILNVSSGETTRPSPLMAAYGAAKAAINHLTQTMAVELGPAGIRVVAIAPGTTLTEMVRLTFDDERITQTIASNPLRRMTEPDELGRLAVFLVSDLARCITGQLFLADAGAHLSRTRPPNRGPAATVP